MGVCRSEREKEVEVGVMVFVSGDVWWMVAD